MPWQTFDGDPRMQTLLRMLAAFSQATDPQAVLRTFSAGIRELDGVAGFISLSCRDLEPGAYRITRLLTQDNTHDIDKADPWSTRGQNPVHRVGLLGRLVESGGPVLVDPLEVADDPVIGDAVKDYRSLIAIPIFDDGRPLNWAVQLRKTPGYYTPRLLEEAVMRSNLVGGTVRQVQTAAALRKANERSAAEVLRIAAIQRALLPPELPDVPGITFAASYETFDTAGGDMYLFHPMGTSHHAEGEHDGRWAIFVGDVAGHGPAAAVVMAMVHAINYAYAQPGRGLDQFLEFVNRHLVAKRIEQSFVTAVASVLDPATLQLSYSCAGHPPPLLRRPGQSPTVRPLPAVGNLPLGILPDVDYPWTTCQLQRGDTVVFYTDGITESRNAKGLFFGVDGIAHALGHCSGTPACAVDTIKARLHDFQAGSRPQDDQTLLVMHVEP